MGERDEVVLEVIMLEDVCKIYGCFRKSRFCLDELTGWDRDVGSLRLHC